MQYLTSKQEDVAMDEFSVTLMRTKVTPGTARYDAAGDERAPIRDIYVSKRAFKGGPIPELLLVTVRDQFCRRAHGFTGPTPCTPAFC